LGFNAKGHNFFETAKELLTHLHLTQWNTACIGITTLTWLWCTKKWGRAFLAKTGLHGLALEISFRAAPVLAIATGIAAVTFLKLQDVSTIGEIPATLPSLFFPSLNASDWMALVTPAVLIALVGFVETVSVGHTLAAKRKQRINPNQELLGLGAANLASGLFGGYSVTGGFSRSVVNFDAGAQTPMAGVFTAAGILLAAVSLTPLLKNLPHATLAAAIIVAVLGLIDFKLPEILWRYSKKDFLAYLLTLIVVLVLGVETGILTGVAFSILALLTAISKPHWAIVGQIPGTEHFRNEKRHDVKTIEGIVSVRIDESLYFPNARWLEEIILTLGTEAPATKAIVLQCNSINHIDASALEALEQIDENLQSMNIILYLSEVKGPVEDQLAKTPWYQRMQNQNRIGLTHLESLKLAQNHIRSKGKE
jgi:sulfate permease, SulP family